MDLSFLQNLKDIDFGGNLYTLAARWVFVILALYILVRCIVSLIKSKNPAEVWAYLKISSSVGESGDSDGISEISVPLTHWENVIGRASSCDISVDDELLSRNHGLLMRDEYGKWTFRDLGSRNGTFLNEGEDKQSYKEYRTGGYSDRNAYLDYLAEMAGGNESGFVKISAEKGGIGNEIDLEYGDIIRAGMTDFTLLPISLEEKNNNRQMRRSDTKLLSAGPTVAALTLFQIMTVIQLWISLGTELLPEIFFAFGGIIAIEWIYFAVIKLSGNSGFEMEIISFFLSTLSLAVVASKSPEALSKQLTAIGAGVFIMFGMCVYLRDLERSKIIRWFMIFASAVLLLLNLTMGTLTYGAKNWLEIGGFSFQPSELVKIAFIWVGAATLDELFNKKNLYIFIGFSLFCFACLGIMGDFGTAMVFFVTFLIISFLRSGEISKLLLLTGVAAAGGTMVLRFKPYVATRFATWGNIWEPDIVNNAGFQQTRTLSASASGGLVGVGAGNGWLSQVFAADTDLVFGMLIEEWGLIIACLAVLSIATLAVFAVRAIISGRSTFFTIAACGAMSMFIFQTMLNIFGCTDILPFTGVTFPFVSNGGTSMLVSWALLAFLKSSDTRASASLAVKGGGRI